MKCNQSRRGFELVSPCPFPTTITITPRAPPYNTQHYKVRIKGKVEQSRERSGALSYTMVLQLSKREPSGQPRLLSPTLLLLTFSLIWRKSIVMGPFMPQKNVNMTFFTDRCTLNFFFSGESVFLLYELSFRFFLSLFPLLFSSLPSFFLSRSLSLFIFSLFLSHLP